MSSRALPPDTDTADPWAVDLRELSDEVVTAGVEDLHREIAGLQASVARLIGEAERRGIPVSEGFGSTTSWLIAHTQDPPGVCRSRVATARALRHMPHTREAFSSGELSECRARRLVEARDAAPEVFERDEELLVDQALTLDARTFPKAVGHWQRLADQDRFAEDHRGMHDARSLHVSRTWGGMTRVDGNLDPESGHVLITALEAITSPGNLDPTDTRTATQKRADALCEIARFYLDHGDTPTLGGEKPHITVVVDLESLENRAGRRCELDVDGAITPQAARRLACDAQITRIITQGESQPLDVGRATRTIPAGLRKALNLRDGGCTHPGCHVPARWCDAHHITHWIDGGITVIRNLILLCRRHHLDAHQHDGYPLRQ
jgi:hypothetical protein